MSASVTTLTGLLEHHAREHGAALALAQLGNDGEIVESRSFGDIHRNALRLAASLGARPRGERVILAPAAPIAFVEGFFGLLCAGLIPVPAPAPRTDAARHRIGAQARDCEATSALVGEAELRLLRSRTGDVDLTFTSVESLVEASRPQAMANAEPDDIAFLQYTSGSTSSPRGAIVTHRSVLANEAQMAAVLAHDESTVFGNWLPLFHDMGLIGGVLQPFFLGVPGYHLTPLQFHAQPARWLHAIGRYGITTTGGPNFAYDACVDRIPEHERRFDLSSWRVAFNGAEPVRAQTLRRFAAAFEPHGFRPSSFVPCYGMAEATLFVSGVPAGRGRLHGDDEVVSCGVRPPGVTCVIADPQSGSLAAEEQEGEILIAGENVSASYWREAAEDRAARFAEHRLDGAPVSFLRSGDLGFLRGGELFVTGRLKDLIIRQGGNIHPSDLEGAALDADVPARRKSAAAFALDDGSIVVLTECADLEAPALDAQARKVRARVLDRCGVHAEIVGLVLRDHLPVTTSGKIRRRECRRLFEERLFERVHVNTVAADVALGSADAASVAPEAVRELTMAYLSERLARPVGVDDLEASIADLGLDSIDAVVLGMRLSEAFGIDVSAVRVLSASRLVDLLDALPTAPPRADRPLADASQVSATAEALVVLSQREPELASGNVTVAFDLPASVSRASIEQALARIGRRHPVLRSRFVQGPDGLGLARIEPYVPSFVVRDTEAADLAPELDRAAGTPFDLFAEAPWRTCLYRVDGAQTIQFVMHHAAVDLWSLSIVMAELCRELSGRPGPDSEIAPGAFRGFSPGERDAALDYWRVALPDRVRRLRVPGPQRPIESPAGRFVPFELGEEDTARLLEYARAHQCSLAVVVLAAYQSALAVYAGEPRIVTTVPFHGREKPAAQGAVGCFVNPLPIVTDISPGDSLETLVGRIRDSILRVMELQAVPIAEAGLDVERDGTRSALLQFGFAPQNVGTDGHDEVTALSIRGFEQPLVVEGLAIRPRSVARFEPAADVLLSTARFRGRLVCSLEFDAARVDAGFAAGVVALTGAVLRGIAADPARKTLAAFRVDPEGHGWAGPSVLAGPVPRVEAPSLFHLVDGRRRAWNDASAVEQGGIKWRYRDLLSHAQVAAANLQRHGVRPGDRVAVLSEITPASLALALGLWACGAAYCPIDPRYPAERRRTMLDLLDAALIVERPEEWLVDDEAAATAETASFLTAHARRPTAATSDSATPEPTATPDAALGELTAYVIFTSGSTGRPKGVDVSHRAIVNTVGAQRIFEIAPGDRVLQACSPGFDASVFEITLALAFGGTLLLPERRLADGDTLATAWEKLRPDVAVLPSSMAAALGAAAAAPRQLILAGEPCPPALVAAWAGRCRLYNAYGPTETAIWATVEPLTEPDAFPYVGRPIDGVTVAVVDERLRPLPAGAPGELVIGGAGVATGYLGEPALTADRFVRPDPHMGVVYRSGDRARVSADGRVELLGRLDRQIKRSGVRVELGEIEAIIERAPGVRRAVVVDVPMPQGPIVGAFVLADGAVTEAALRAHVARFLPPAFMPMLIEFRDALPLEAHGKVDLRALRDAVAPRIGPRENEAGRVPAADRRVPDDLDTPLLRTIAAVCAEVFGVTPASARDNLLMLGVHSLSVARFVGRLSTAVQRDIPLSLAFERPALADFADAVAHLPLRASLASDGADAGADVKAEYPLTPVQRDLWYVGELGRHADYSIALAFDVTGPLDEALLRRAVDHVVASHPSLRASVVDRNGEPHQVFATTCADVVEIVPLDETAGAPDTAPVSGKPVGADVDAVRVDAVRHDMEARIAAPNDAYRFRVLVYRLSADRHVLGVIGHHLFLDGWSLGRVLDDLGQAYAALLGGSPLPAIGDGTALRRHLDGETAPGVHDARLEQWRARLAGVEMGRYLPDRGAAQYPAPPHSLTIALPAAQRGALIAAAQATGVSLFSVVTTALAIVAARHQGGTDAIVSVVAANRGTPERQSLVGCLATSLPIRVALAADDATDSLWRTVHREILAASGRSGPSVSAIAASLPEAHGTGRSPLLSTMVVQNDRAFYDLQLGDARLRTAALPWRLSPAPRADLLLEVTDDGEILLRPETDPVVLTPTRTKRIAAMLEHVLGCWAGGVRQPLSAFDALSPAERTLVVHGFNATARDYDLDAPLHRLVEAAADRWPDACAVSSEGAAVNYRQFEERVNRLANTLVARGLQVGTPVGVCSPPGLGLVVALHAVMKAGAAYVPLDPANPADRLAWSVRELGIRFVVGESQTELWQSVGIEHVLDPLPETGDSRRPAIDVKRSDPAYVLFTSGSTGTPKAAINRHESIVNRLRWMQEAMPLAPGDRVLQKTSFTFDVSVWEFFWPLTTGATLCTLLPGQNLDATELYSVMRREQISTVHFVPSALADFLQSRPSFELPDLRRIVVSGEELTPALRDAVFAALPVELHNLYGPTEAAIDVTHWRCARDEGPGRVPIGMPVANTQIYVLDSRGQPSPVGAPGEIFIGGVQVASGYAANAAETHKRFGANPFEGGTPSRLYRTGDAGRWTEQGCVEFLGRLDDQVKIRGIRIELGEIVAAMKALPGVLDATVLVRGTGSRRRLTGFVVPKADHHVDAADLRAQLSEWLPSAMVPSAIVAIDRIPLRSSGKTDTAALARLAGDDEPARDIAPPSSEMEQTILTVWREVLDAERIGVTDSFFDVGGNSALLMQVQTRLTRALGRNVPVVDLLRHTTVRKLAQAIGTAAEQVEAAPARSAAMRASVNRLAKLAALQRDRR